MSASETSVMLLRQRVKTVSHCRVAELRAESRSEAFALVAPTRVSPASAAEQKQHYQNNQYGFHCCTPNSLREAGLAFVAAISFLHYASMVQVPKTDSLSTLNHFV
jgi:hypothetical protein